MKTEESDLEEQARSDRQAADIPADVSLGSDVEQAVQDRLEALRRGVSAERFVSPAKSPKRTQEEWSEFILSVAGSIPDPSFRRHDQGTFEQRDDWSPTPPIGVARPTDRSELSVDCCDFLGERFDAGHSQRRRVQPSFGITN